MKTKYNVSIYTKLTMVLVLGLFYISPTLVFGATSTPETNLVPNPQMLNATVSSTTPDSWSQGHYGTSTATYNYPVPGPNPGDKAVEVILSNYESGAAEWFFQSVPVTGGSLYAFTDSYKSDIENYVIAQWTMSDGSLAYDAITTLSPTNGIWANTPQELFQAPDNAVSLTILHLIQNTNGTLDTTNYSLTAFTPTGQGSFAKAMVSLTFDNGWSSQFNNGRPILNAAHMPVTYYIITNSTLDATAGVSNNFFDSSGISTTTTISSSTVNWGDITNINNFGAVYTDPTYQSYIFTDTYTSSTTSNLFVKYCSVTFTGDCPAASVTSMGVGALPAGNNATANISFTLPTVSGNTVSPISISQVSDQGELITASNPFLTESQSFMTESQLRTLQSEGNQMDSHTKTHPDLNLTTLDVATSNDEIAGSRSALLSFGLSPVDGFAYPFGSYNTTVKQMVSSAGYTNARTVDVGFNTTASDPLMLKSESVTALTTFATIKSWIDTAIANKLWLVITFHDVDPQNIIDQNNETYGVTPTMLQNIVTYLQTQSGSIDVLTMDQALSRLTGTQPPPLVIPAVTITPPTLPNGVVGTPYTQTLTPSTTATGPFTWTVTSGALPTNLILGSTSGIISGTPTTTGTSTFSVKVTNGSASTTQSFSIGINASSTPLPPPVISTITITPTSLPNGKVGSVYSQLLTASTTATGPFTWSLSAGALPLNLSLGTSTGLISGTSTTAGTSTFSVMVTNGTASTTQAFSIGINASSTSSTPPPPVKPHSGGTGGGGRVGGFAFLINRIKGDLNNDGKIDLFDFNLLITNWGKINTSITEALSGSNDAVGLKDFNTLMVNWI